MTLQESLRDYPHLRFQRQWTLTHSTLLNLGQCVAIVRTLGAIPISPSLQSEFRKVAFQRGAQATTAIEGNTLTDEEFRRMLEGQELPKSREYQAQEVRNAIEAMEFLWNQIVRDGRDDSVSVSLLSELNRRIGKDLGALYDGVPGKLRLDRRHVGRYLAPPPEVLNTLLHDFCDWLRAEFGFHSGKQSLDQAIVQAIVAHVYFEWIHPFADGNGRTGRLLEFYILLRAGLPDIAAHVLANHYNATRQEYAAHFDNARRKRDLTEFISYAVQGLLDGLSRTHDDVMSEAFQVVWKAHIYDVFAGYSDYRKRSVFKRRRNLALNMPLDCDFSEEELLMSDSSLLKEYLGHDRRTLKADLDVLLELGLATEEHGRFRAQTSLLRQQHQAPRRNSVPTARH